LSYGCFNSRRRDRKCSARPREMMRRSSRLPIATTEGSSRVP
jgi:hypothetical protein